VKKSCFFVILTLVILASASCASGLRSGENIDEQWGVLHPFQRDDLWGYKDDSGNIVIEPKFRVARNFSEGLAFVVIDGSTTSQRGFIDSSGEMVIFLDPDGIFAHDFSEGFSRVIDREWDFENERPNVIGTIGPYIFIDRAGRNVFGQEFEIAEDFNRGIALVAPYNENYFFINWMGRNAFGREFLYARNFNSEGYARVTLLNGRVRFMTRSGRLFSTPR